MYERTIADEPRTNNILEGWHRRFNTIVAKHHPNIYGFLERLKWGRGAAWGGGGDGSGGAGSYRYSGGAVDRWTTDAATPHESMYDSNKVEI